MRKKGEMTKREKKEKTPNSGLRLSLSNPEGLPMVLPIFLGATGNFHFPVSRLGTVVSILDYPVGEALILRIVGPTMV